MPYRFHAHWSGSDIDGQVIGYYVAVTETIPGGHVPLPPPKPQQWRFTTRTDSVFVFNIHEGLGTDRRHGLYVFAVDNEGKTDPTPAFTRFVARDRNLPGIEWTTHRAVGRIFLPAPGGGVQEAPFLRELTDPQDPVGATFQPRDTLPVGSEVYFAWTAFDRDWASSVLGYRYKLYEPDYVKTDPTGNSVSYGTGVGPTAAPPPIGLNVFRVRAVDEAGGTTFPDSVRRFVVNFDPDSWWFGPDTTDANIASALVRDERGAYLPSAGGEVPEVLAKWLAPDRFNHLPADRKTVGLAEAKGMRTFLEKVRFPTKTRFYVHVDSDTVARNAEAVYLFAGGSDKDSPYSVPIQASSPPGHPVGTPGPANGSPVGAEFRLTRLNVDNTPQTPAWSVTYPNFDPLSVAYKPEIYYTSDEKFTGATFAQVRMVDGNGGKDRRISQPIGYMINYTAGALSEEQAKLRPLLMVWFVNFNPYFQTDVPQFSPTPDTLILSTPFKARLFMSDPDSTATPPNRAPFLVRVRVLTQADYDNPNLPPNTGWQTLPILMYSGEEYSISIPDDLPPGRNYFEIELSDFPSELPRDRRTVYGRFPFYWSTRP